MEPVPPEVEAWSLIYWTTTEVLGKQHMGADLAKAAWDSSERRAGETDGGAGGSRPGRETEQGCLSKCWG